MTTIEEITHAERLPGDVIADLKNKTISIIPWAQLEKQYEQSKHPVMDKMIYPDKVVKGKVEKVTRITLGLQKLAVKRMTGLMFGIPVQRVWKPKEGNAQEKRAAEILEAMFMKNRIDSMNRERSKYLFAGCEFVTIWYTQEQEAEYAGEPTDLKIRSVSFSPMNGDQLYPLFDEFGDLVALSVEYSRTENSLTVSYFETYTATEHIRWRNEGNNIVEEKREKIEFGKIPGIYIYRPTPIWEDESGNIEEAEWTLSRSGNYIRKNARPNWVVYSNEKIKHGKEPANDNAGRNVLQYGKDDKAGYVTWEQAIDTIKFHIDQIYQNFFKQLQLPDMSMENMKLTPMSGEARKMVFIDAQMKVTDESGIWLEAFDREVNVVKAIAMTMYPKLAEAIKAVQCEVLISPYQIKDEGEKINNLISATGGKAIMSQRTAIQYLGYVDDIDKEIKQIQEESEVNLFAEPTTSDTGFDNNDEPKNPKDDKTGKGKEEK